MHWNFDREHSELFIRVNHLGLSNISAQFTDFKVKLKADKNLASGIFEVTVTTDSLTSRNKIRDEHLKNSDFLWVEKYPRIYFKSDKINFEEGQNVEMTGELTLLGTSRKIMLQVKNGGLAKDSFTKEVKTGFTVEGRFDRREFGMDFNIPLELGTFAVGNMVKIRAEVEFVSV